MMRRIGGVLIVVILAALPTACAAGSYTVTVVDETQLRAIATKESITAQQVVQRAVDAFVRQQQQAEINRAVAACRSGNDDKACASIPAMVKKLGK